LQLYFAGAEKGIDEYYRQQEEMLEGFEEMDTIAERGYMPSTTQVSWEQCVSLSWMICYFMLLFNVLLWCSKVHKSYFDGEGYVCYFDNMKHGLHLLQRGSFFWSKRFNLAYLLQEERDNIKKGEKFAIQISNIMNMVIFAAKVYACVRSGSLAIIASTLDSLLNLLSGFILWFTSISMRKENPYLYPIGKRRMQPLVNSYFDS
jgi:hypothetical protein